MLINRHPRTLRVAGIIQPHLLVAGRVHHPEAAIAAALHRIKAQLRHHRQLRLASARGRRQHRLRRRGARRRHRRRVHLLARARFRLAGRLWRAIDLLDARKLLHQRQQLADRRVQHDGIHRLAVGATRQPLVVAVHHVAIRRHQDRAVAALEVLCLLHLGRRELGLRRLQLARRHLDAAAADAARLQEVDQRAPVLRLDLRHLGARHAQRPRLRGKGAPLGIARRAV